MNRLGAWILAAALWVGCVFSAPAHAYTECGYEWGGEYRCIEYGKPKDEWSACRRAYYDHRREIYYSPALVLDANHIQGQSAVVMLGVLAYLVTYGNNVYLPYVFIGSGLATVTTFTVLDWMRVAANLEYYEGIVRVERMLIEAEKGETAEIQKLIDEDRELPADPEIVRMALLKGDAESAFCHQKKPYTLEEIREWLKIRLGPAY